MPLVYLQLGGIRTTELYYARRDEDAESAARRIQIRVSRAKSFEP